MKRLTWLVIPTLALSLMAPAAMAADAPGSPYRPKSFVQASQTDRPLAQGLILSSFERLYPGGWVNGWLLTVDLANPLIQTDLVTAPSVNKGEALSVLAGRAGAVAAVNGDFFDIGQTGIALGSQVRGGEFLQSRIPDWPNAAGVSKDRIGRLVDVALEGTVTLPGGRYPLGAINLPTVPSGSIGLFTPMWTLPRDRAMYGASEAREVIVKAGKVISVSETVTPQPIPADGFVLVGREEYAKRLSTLKVGDKVTLSYGPKPDLQWAVGGKNHLVKKGEIDPKLDDKAYGPRSAVGFSPDGRKMYLLAVDGRSGVSSGLTLRELAEMMQGFGATEVLELDGGGSTTMVARLPGKLGLSLVNRPSDGRERSIPNGVGIFAARGSGLAKSLSVQAHSDRVFPGLSRTLSVEAYDEQYGPAPVGPVTWRLEGAGEVTPQGIFRAAQLGPATVVAETTVLAAGSGSLASTEPTMPAQPVSLERINGQLNLKVLGPLVRVEVVGEGLELAPGKTGSFSIRGYDPDGYAAPIDPVDLSFVYDNTLMKVEPAGSAVQVTALKEGAGLIRVLVQGKETWVPVASAKTETVLDLFDKLAAWKFDKYPAQSVTGALSAAPGRSGNGLKLTYAFSGTGTRAAYADTNPVLVLPGKPEAFGLWVKGDGKGAWLRAVLIDASGKSHTVNLARHVDWIDWRYVEALVPAGAPYPLKLQRIYPVEADANKQYAGELLFDDLTVRSPMTLPPLTLPPGPAPAPDAILQPTAPPSQQAWHFALVGGLGMPVGQLSNTKTLLSPADEALRQALAAKPAFFVIDPALTSAADEALLKQAAGETPVYKVTRPGGQVDVNGVRFVLLGTQEGSLRSTQFEQLLGLKSMLDLARLDTKVRQVVVLGHHTPDRFTDQREGDLVTRWMAEFEERSGKPAAYLATGGTASAVRRVEGIPFIEAGSPKAPLLFSIDPAPGAVWLRVTNP